MKLKELNTFHDYAVKQILDQYGYKIDTGCPGGFEPCILSRIILDPSKYLKFETSIENKEYGICNVLIAANIVVNDIFEKLYNNNTNIMKVIDMDNNHKKFILPNVKNTLYRNKLYLFTKTENNKDFALSFYNLENN